MQITVSPTPAELGLRAAEKAAECLRSAVESRGRARMLVSTGQSQFEFFQAIIAMELPWDMVELFHLDEYIGLPATHRASFRKYLQERFVSRIGGAVMHYIDGEGDAGAVIALLSDEIRRAPVDVGVIGIGENAHIAFNDPPADFATREAFRVVELSETCRRQQVNEGWFPSVDDVPPTAISATVHQILQCRTIVSAVPHRAKAVAVRDTLTAGAATNQIPATALTAHPDWHLFLDEASASLWQAAR